MPDGKFRSLSSADLIAPPSPVSLFANGAYKLASPCYKLPVCDTNPDAASRKKDVSASGHGSLLQRDSLNWQTFPQWIDGFRDMKALATFEAIGTGHRHHRRWIEDFEGCLRQDRLYHRYLTMAAHRPRPRVADSINSESHGNL